MKLRRLQIENFRGIENVDLEFDDTTVLIGENNSGKSAVLDALRACLRDQGGRKAADFDAYDFHLATATADPASAPPILITLTFAERVVGEWDVAVAGALQRAGILQVDPNEGRGQVILRVRAIFDSTTNEIHSDAAFLDLMGNPLGVHSRGLTALREQVSYFYLSALRDAARHFDPRGQFWRPFLRGSNLTPEQREQIEHALESVNDQIIASHAGFDTARDKLRRVQEIVPMTGGDVVSFDAVPARIFDMLAKTQISLGTATGAKIPVDRHGEGTQSLAVLMLFNAFLEAWGKGSPIIALEEPEAHLHPSAARSLWRLIEQLPGQKIVTTHSGSLISELPVASIRRLRRSQTAITQHRLHAASLTARQAEQFNIHVRLLRGELLFARCWLLVEGESEMILQSEIARFLGINFDRLGVTCIPYRRADIAVYLKAANDLGIRWCAVTDSDNQGVADQQKVRAHLNGAVEADVHFPMPTPNLETYLCSVGFGPVYAAHPDSKPAAALEVIARIHAGQAVPPLLEGAVRAAALLAEAG